MRHRLLSDTCSELSTKCCFCGGEIEPRRVTAENWWGDSLALVQKVPAVVCCNCGDVYFEADVCRKLGKLRAAPPSALKLPVAASRRTYVAPASRR